MSTLQEQLDLLEKYPQAVKAAIMGAEDRMVDVVGVIHSNQAAVRDLKRTAMSEIGDGEIGQRWKVEIGRSAKRTYNDSSLLWKLSDGSNIINTLKFLMTTKVLKITWSYTNLMKLIRTRNIDITTTQHEIVDGDEDYDIGEVWGDASPKFVHVEKEN